MIKRPARRRSEGAAYVETLVAFPAIFFAFASLFTFGHLCAAQLIVQRAASAAARAAVVFLPDDPEYYDQGGAASRDACVKQAAKQVLLASPHFKLDDGAIEVTMKGTKHNFDPLTVRVRAQFDCRMFLGSFLCGADQIAHIASTATLSFQEGPVEP